MLLKTELLIMSKSLAVKLFPDAMRSLFQEHWLIHKAVDEAQITSGRNCKATANWPLPMRSDSAISTVVD